MFVLIVMFLPRQTIKLRLLGAAFLTLIPVCLSGQVLQKPEDRRELLNSMEQVLSVVNEPLSSYAEISSPFVLGREVEPEQEVAAEEETPGQKEQQTAADRPSRLSDSAALRMIAKRFHPIGCLVVGNRGILQMDGGRNLAEGETFQAKINGLPYTVRIAEVGQNGYVLRLGKALLEQNFLSAGVTRGKGKAPYSHDSVPNPND